MSEAPATHTHPVALVLAFAVGMGGMLWWRLGSGPAPEAPSASGPALEPGEAPDGPVRCDLPPADGAVGRLTGRFGGRQLISVEVGLHDDVLDLDTRGVKSAGPERRWSDAQADTVLRLAGFTAGNAWLERGDDQILALQIDPDGGCRMVGRAEVQPPAREVRCTVLGEGAFPLVAMVVTRPQPVGEGLWTLAPVSLRLDRDSRAVHAMGPEAFVGTGWFTWDRAEGPEKPVGLPISWDAEGCAPILLP